MQTVDRSASRERRAMGDNSISVKKMAELAPEIICFGHGKPLFEDVHSRLLALIERSGG